MANIQPIRRQAYLDATTTTSTMAGSPANKSTHDVGLKDETRLIDLEPLIGAEEASKFLGFQPITILREERDDLDSAACELGAVSPV